MNREQAKGALGLLAGLALLAGCFFLDKKEQAREPMVRSDFLLNTFVTISVYDSDDETLLDGAMDLCRGKRDLPAEPQVSRRDRLFPEQRHSLSDRGGALLQPPVGRGLRSDSRAFKLSLGLHKRTERHSAEGGH